MCKHGKILAFILVLAVCIGMPAARADWLENGVAICTANGVQDTPVIISDFSGGAIVAWRDDRVINTDIYAQRVDALGNVLWLGTAMPVCTAPNAQSYPASIPDGSGGAIITWVDARSGNVPEIYAQRLNCDGYAQWTANGEPVCTGQTGLLLGRIIADGAGGAIISWHDRRNFTNDIYVQRIGADGAVQWTVNGVAVCTALEHQESPALASDGAGGAIVAWQDRRNGASDIYAQSIDAAGGARWAADGIVICDAGQAQTSPRIIPDGAGGAIIAWTDRRNTIDYDIFAQRVDEDGNLLWTTVGVAVCQTMYNQTDCRLVPTESVGEVIIAWIDYRGGSSSDVYAQKIDAGGAPLWVSKGIVVCGAADDQLNVQLISNGSGGAVAVWDDGRGGTGPRDLYAQRIDANGTVGWAADGETICTAAGDQTTPWITPDGCGGACIAWRDERDGTADIYSQRIDDAGHIGTATMLRSFSSALSGSGVELEWTLSEARDEIEFFMLRASEPSMIFREISPAGIHEDGMSFSFIDSGCEPGVTYHYRVDVRDDGDRKVLFETGPITIPAMALTLYQNLPNPFNPSTTIRFYVPERCRVTLDVYGVGGGHIVRLVDGNREKGSYTAVWNGCDSRGRRMGSGVYFYRLRAGKRMLSRKMLLIR